MQNDVAFAHAESATNVKQIRNFFMIVILGVGVITQYSTVLLVWIISGWIARLSRAKQELLKNNLKVVENIENEYIGCHSLGLLGSNTLTYISKRPAHLCGPLMSLR